MDEFLTNKELFSLVEVIIGARAFSKMELLALTDKLKRFTTTEDRPKLNELIRKELYHYAEVKHDCESVQERLWQIVNCVADHKEISIDYYRMDRIKNITEHRQGISQDTIPDFDEGLLRKRSLFMWPGKLRTIRFAFSGPSVQAVLDKLPTARIIEALGDKKYLIEAETYGDGIKVWLLSQGRWVKVVSPADFVEEIKNMSENYM